MTPVFVTPSPVDEILQWAEKLSALGEAVIMLSYHEEEDGFFQSNGDVLGAIITDYGDKLRQALDYALPALRDFFTGKWNSLHEELTRDFNAIQDPPYGRYSQERVDDMLEKVDGFLAESLVMRDWKKRLEEMKVELSGPRRAIKGDKNGIHVDPAH